MHYFFFMMFFAFSMGYLIIGMYILLKDKNSSLNRLVLLLCLETSIWAFGYAMMIISPNMTVANYMRIVSALGWSFFASTWLDFVLSIAYVNEKKTRLKRRLIIYPLSLLFLVDSITYAPELVVKKFSVGYSELTPVSFISGFYAVYYISFVLTSLLILYFWGRRSRLNREKKQAKVIVIATLITISIAALTDTILPNLKYEGFQFGIIIISISMLGLLRAITKYKMMAITPEYVSDYIYKGVNNPILFIDRHLNLISTNHIAIEMIGYEPFEMNASFFEDVIKLNEIEVDVLMDNGAINNREIIFIKKDGSLLQFILSATLIYDGFRDMLGIVIILQDVSRLKEANRLLLNYNNELENEVAERTSKLLSSNQVLQDEIAERKLAQEKIVYMGYYDELTGLPNRRFFNEHITAQIDQIQSENANLAIMFLDIDDFKIINDTYGHLAGDELLKQIAVRLKSVIKEGDLLARIGGDEFLVLLTHNTRIGMDIHHYATNVSENTMKVFKEPVMINGKENFVTTSIGVAFYPYDGEDVDTLIMNADMTMYEAKGTKKNTIMFCTTEIKNKMQEKTRFRNDLYRAIERGELMVYYQPQVNILTNKIIGYEVLLRWYYKNERFISPLEFVPLAEETGLIIPIGYWVLNTVCSDYCRLRGANNNQLYVAVNLSKNQLMERDFIPEVMKIINSYHIKPEFFEFEITERITLKDNDEISVKLYELKELGFRISIDDFGTEFSSFMNLKNLPIDKIKIAMEFVQESTKNRKDAAIVKSIIDLSHELNLSVIAEGVETQEQLEFIRKNHCNEVQGYFFYKPMSFEALERVLNA